MCICVYAREGANLCTFERGRGASTAGAPRGGTQYCGSINLNKVNFCRGASEYGNFVFRRLGRVGRAARRSRLEYRLSIYFVYIRVPCAARTPANLRAYALTRAFSPLSFAFFSPSQKAEEEGCV